MEPSGVVLPERKKRDPSHRPTLHDVEWITTIALARRRIVERWEVCGFLRTHRLPMLPRGPVSIGHAAWALAIAPWEVSELILDRELRLDSDGMVDGDAVIALREKLDERDRSVGHRKRAEVRR
jgi:hypothetical protein